ncbi:hypothetical protein M0R45_003041 [Rubus argutus]|uniref:Uncharacterized protein n=1 Tax=Rubus argutus TaxID=59490 RepID=A0AAW1YGU8_RUBAR
MVSEDLKHLVMVILLALHTNRQFSKNITDPGREGSTPNIRQPNQSSGRSIRHGHLVVLLVLQKLNQGLVMKEYFCLIYFIQVMPLISQAASREPGLVPAEVENSSERTMAQGSSTLVCMLHHLSFHDLLPLVTTVVHSYEREITKAHNQSSSNA